MKVEEKKANTSQMVRTKNAINYQDIIIDEFPVLEILALEIKAKENEHARLHLVQRFDEDSADEVVYETVVGNEIHVSYLDKENTKIPAFCGIISDLRSFYEDGARKIELHALSLSSNLDVYRSSKSFQNSKKTYQEVMNGCMKDYKGSLIFDTTMQQFTKNMPDFSLQYKETDWAYIKRLASHKNQGLFVDMTSTKPDIYVGCSNIRQGELEAIFCEYHKDLQGFHYERANYLQELIEEDYLFYIAESYQFFPIGTQVTFHGKSLYIKEAHYSLKTNIFTAQYVLCPKNGLKVRKFFNEKLQGISINGICQKSERDKVFIWLNVDQKNNSEYLFPYSTMSASPDGSGWYCMPEKGDLLRVYFPDCDESNCFAISSESAYTPDTAGGGSNGGSGDGAGITNGASQDRMGDPNVRYLRTPDNKEIKLSPDGIVINADDGQAVIAMDNSGNITISGAGSISMNASNDISIVATNNVTMMATESLKISGTAGSIELTSDGNTKLTGEYVLEN